MQLSNPAVVEIAQITTWDGIRWGSGGIVLFSLVLSGHHCGLLNWKGFQIIWFIQAP